MKMRVVALFICVVFLASFISAEIIINEQPKDMYNIGDVINFPIKIAASVDTYDFLSVNLYSDVVNKEEKLFFSRSNIGKRILLEASKESENSFPVGFVYEFGRKDFSVSKIEGAGD